MLDNVVRMCLWSCCVVFFFKQKTAYEMRISDWSSDVCSSDLDRAFYDPVRDNIHMPEPQLFKSDYEYAATALHELGHATGHKSRMDRQFGPFGSEIYAREELRAEMASYITRSEEHTSELQSLMRNPYAVFCLKKKNITTNHSTTSYN